MSFELDDAGRTEPRWIEYGSGRVKVRFKVRPRDLEVVKKLNAAFALDERIDQLLEEFCRHGALRYGQDADAFNSFFGAAGALFQQFIEPLFEWRNTRRQQTGRLQLINQFHHAEQGVDLSLREPDTR